MITKNIISIALLFISIAGFSQTPQLTKDINTDYQSSSPAGFHAYAGSLYFSATSNTQIGKELWKTDGSDTGTQLVLDINPGVSSSAPDYFVSGGNMLFFTAQDQNNGTEIWRTDGTDTGTKIIKDIRTGSASSNARGLHYMSHKGILIIAAYEEVNGTELWKTDGTSAGTQLLKDINPGISGSNPRALTAMGNLFFFTATNGSTGSELWVTDGTDTGTKLLKDIRPGATTSVISRPTIAAGVLFFSANDGTNGTELWKTDGTVAGTKMLKDIRAGNVSGSVNNLIAHDSKLFFTANDGIHGNELWTSDGTSVGTKMYMDYIKGPGAPGLSSPVVYKNTLYFSGSALGSGRELFRLDPIDTLSYIDINKFGSSSPKNLTVVGSKLFFLAEVDKGEELYVSDGTASGTKLTRDLYPIQTDAQIKWMTVVDSTLYFVSHQTPYYQNFELYAATSSNTRPTRVKDIIPGATASNPTNLFPFKGKLIFTVNDEIHGLELWESSSSSKANILKDIHTGTKNAGIVSMAGYKGGIMFNAQTDKGDELWKSSGSSASTTLVDDIKSGTNSSSPRNLFSDQNRVFFTASQTSNTRLFYSDGTEVGTKYVYFGSGNFAYINQLRIKNNLYLTFKGLSSNNLYRYTSGSNGAKVKTINPNGLGDKVGNLTNYKDMLFFTADDGITNGHELWKTNGTSGGTEVVKNIRSGNTDSDPNNLLVVDTVLLFSANDGSTGSELWKSEGDASNTSLIKDINPGAIGSNIKEMTYFNHKAYFTANDGSTGTELWVSDGTAANTTLFKDIIAGASGSHPSQLVATQKHLYFVVDDSIHGKELWVSDGTLMGTKLLKDIFIGAKSAHIGNLTKVRDMLYFTADDGINGNELWKTDGTVLGTEMISEVHKGKNGSNPSLLTLSNDTLYYVANHPDYGDEVWYIFTHCMVRGMTATSGCIKDSLQFTDQTNPLGNTITKYRWDFGNGDTSSLKNPKYAFNTLGSHEIRLRVETMEGCETETSATIQVDSFPIASFIVNLDTQCFKTNSFKFTNKSTPGATYKWTYGNGQTSNSASPTYKYSKSGDYTVELTAVNTAGCGASANMKISISPSPSKPIILGKQWTNSNKIDTFQVTNNTGSTYQWLVTNGVINKGQGTNQILVDWIDSKSIGTVRVTETNRHNCPSDQGTKTIGLAKVGTSSITPSNNLRIYPNPTDAQVLVESEHSGMLMLFDAHGKQIKKLPFNGLLLLDVSHLRSGIYTLNLITDKGISVQKLNIY